MRWIRELSRRPYSNIHKPAALKRQGVPVKYDEFLNKLDEFRREFCDSRGREPADLEEFVAYVRERQLRRPKGGGIKSLKGLAV